jgi:lactoylglutathione lyase
MLRQLEHIGVMVKDMDRSVHFYTEVLGLQLRERRTFRTLELAFLEIGDTEIELIAGEAGYIEKDAIINHIAFTVDNLEEAVTHLKTHGADVDVSDPIELWDGKRCLFFRGPDGEKLEFFEHG